MFGLPPPAKIGAIKRLSGELAARLDELFVAVGRDAGARGNRVLVAACEDARATLRALEEEVRGE